MLRSAPASVQRKRDRCAPVSGAIGEFADAIAIFVFIALNGIIGFIQEYRAEKALEALRALMTPVVRVRRDGNEREVPAEEW